MTSGVQDIHLYDGTHVECINVIERDDSSLKKDDSIPTILTIAGSDSSGGAGIEADIKSISAHGCYALTCIVCLTAQNTKGVKSAINTDARIVEDILDQNFEDIRIDAIKTGLLTNESIPLVEKAIKKYKYCGPLVVDPVMVSTSGYDFLNNVVLRNLIDTLSPHITLITPNLMEAFSIINTYTNQNVYNYNEDSVSQIEDMFVICEKIHQLTNIENVLLKGGHKQWINNDDESNQITDILYISKMKKFTVFHSLAIDSPNTHGTGCTLSSTIASNLALGYSLVNSIANGIVYVQNGIVKSPNISSSDGNGPLNHLQRVKHYNYENDVYFQETFANCKILQYFCNHSEIKPYWEKYSHHEFMKNVNNGSLQLDSFKSFVIQDVKYLQNYTRMILKLTMKNEQMKAMGDNITLLNSVMNEIESYKQIFPSLGLNITLVENFKVSEECQRYMDHLSNVAENGDVLDILVSLAPCHFGFREAALNAIESDGHINDNINEVYKHWMRQNLSEMYREACEEFEVRLDEYFKKYCKSYLKLERLVYIFEESTKMENTFLDSFLK